MKHQIIKHRSVWLGLCCSLSIMPTQLLAQEPTVNSSKLNSGMDPVGDTQVTYQITGSRLLQQGTSTTHAVTIYTREHLLQSGESNVADFIRKLPFNSFGSTRPQTGSREQGDAHVALRGLGTSNTLVLIDGRRLPKSPSNPAATNLNLIPLDAVERIEVLTDAASAIYGSDAVGGVINVITRTDFEGAEIMLGTGFPSLPKNGGETENGSVVFGTSSSRSQLLTGVSWFEQEAVFTRNVPWREIGSSVYSNSFTTITDGFDNFNWTSYLGACDEFGAGYYTLENNSSLNGSRCAYDFSSATSEETSVENKAFFTHATHQINDQWRIQAKALFTQTESFGRYAPVPDSSYFSTPLSANSPNNPTNPNSPLYDPSLGLDPQMVNWWHRFDPLGNRDTTVTTQLIDFKIELTGQIGQANVTFGLHKSNNSSNEVGKNLLLQSAAQNYIEAGTYSLLNPYGTPENVLNAMRFTRYRDARYDQDELFATIAFDLFDLKGGPSQVLVGAEYLKEKYFDLVDPHTQSISSARSAFADRDTQSLFFETHLPFLERLSLNVTGRYDNYSDLGDDLASKVSLNFQPIDQLTINLNYSMNHQVANLNMMNNFDNTTITTFRRDLNWCLEFPESCTVTLTEIFKANYSLKSEQSKHLNLRLNYRPKDWMSISTNFWQIKIKDRLGRFGTQYVITAEINDTPIRGLSCNYATNATQIECITGYGNDGTLDISGVDLTAEIHYSLFEGQLSHQLLISRILDLQMKYESSDVIGTPGYPKHRAVLSNTYSQENWHVAYNINLIGPQYSETSPNAPAPTWVTHDLQVSYDLPWQGTVSVGANNITEKFPPLDAGRITDRAYDDNLYNGFGRIVYARYTQTF